MSELFKKNPFIGQLRIVYLSFTLLGSISGVFFGIHGEAYDPFQKFLFLLIMPIIHLCSILFLLFWVDTVYQYLAFGFMSLGLIFYFVLFSMAPFHVYFSDKSYGVWHYLKVGKVFLFTAIFAFGLSLYGIELFEALRARLEILLS